MASNNDAIQFKEIVAATTRKLFLEEPSDDPASGVEQLEESAEEDVEGADQH